MSWQYVGAGQPVLGPQQSPQAPSVNYDPPESAGGTGLVQGLGDGSEIVRPLASVGNPGDDAGPINESLLRTGYVRLVNAVYTVSSPVMIPPYATLAGIIPASAGIGSPPAPGLRIPKIIAAPSWAPGAAAGVLQFFSQTPGNWGVTAQQQAARRLIIDCSGNSSGNINPVFFTGPCYDTHLDDLLLYGGHNGVHMTNFTESGIVPVLPYHQRWNRVSALQQSFRGFNMTNVTDSIITDCLAGYSQGGGNVGFFVSVCGNTTFIGCRAEWSAASGWQITGNCSGTVTLSGCSTDHNTSNGVLITAAVLGANDGGGVVIAGGKFHADKGSFGIDVTGSTAPVTVDGVIVEVGQTTGTFGPATAFNFDTSTAVTVAGSVLQGTSSAWAAAGGTIARSGCIGATGNPGSQVYARLADI